MAKTEKRVSLFGDWKGRPYQMPLWDYLVNGGKRAVCVWHRRAGKDELALRWAALCMMRTPGSYWHMLPLKEQARTAIWTMVNKHTGRRRIDEAFPSELFDKRDTDMMVTCKANASTWQVKGSDNYESGIGSSVAGIVFSEYSRADPNAWAYLRPILKENDGWALFISTPYGHNHFEKLYELARNEQGWFGERLTWRQTNVLSQKDYEDELREQTTEKGSVDEARAMMDQEWECSFDAAIPGSIYAKIIAEMVDEGRVTKVPHDPGFAVEAWSDLGASEGNDMAVIWTQKVGRETRIIDCDAEINVGIDWLAEKMNERAAKRGFVYAPKSMIFPHDAAHPQSSNRGAQSFAAKFRQDYGYASTVNPVTHSRAWSIDQTKHFLRTCVIDTDHCQRLLEALRHYHRRWDPKLRRMTDDPVHDWSSNLCFTGDTEVLTRHGTCQIMNLPSSGEVRTSCGWSRYQNPRVTRIAAQLVEVRFVGGHTVRCTPDHLFATDSGWKSALSLTPGTAIQSYWMHSHSISMVACTVLAQVIRTLRAAASFCTVQCGHPLSDPSLTVATSTIEIVRHRTIRSTTWSVWTGWSISAFRKKIIMGLVRARGERLLSGISQRQEGYGTRACPSEPRAGRSGSTKTATVSIALWFSARLSEAMRGATAIVLKRARRLRIERVVPLSEMQDVWCLTVPDAQEFALANGAIVHNCDAFRTGSEAKQGDRGGQPLRQRVGLAANQPLPHTARLAIDYDDPLGRH